MNRTRLLLAGTATGAVLAATVLGSPPANADELGYLQLLNMRGHVVNDTASAIAMGWSICDQLNYETGDVVAARLFATTSWTQTRNYVDAAEIMVSAVEGLCPWHDHRGGQLA